MQMRYFTENFMTLEVFYQTVKVIDFPKLLYTLSHLNVSYYGQEMNFPFTQTPAQRMIPSTLCCRLKNVIYFAFSREINIKHLQTSHN